MKLNTEISWQLKLKIKMKFYKMEEKREIGWWSIWNNENRDSFQP